MINACVIIPCYKHANTLESVILRIKPFNISVIVVDDGNTPADALIIKKVSDKYPFVTLLTHEINKGKGYAFATGIKFALEKNYETAIQIDADGQHCIEDLDKMIMQIKAHPNCVISGAPIYDESAPRSRVIGRKITNFFVHIETLSKSIKDAMIGFRAYPVKETFRVIEKYNLYTGMTFDIEVLVRLYWSGIKTFFFDTKIDYPDNGISNFKARDQVKISLMHTKLCCIMLLTLPLRIFNHEK